MGNPKDFSEFAIIFLPYALSLNNDGLYMNYEKAKFQIDDWMRTSIDLGFSGNR